MCSHLLRLGNEMNSCDMCYLIQHRWCSEMFTYVYVYWTRNSTPKTKQCACILYCWDGNAFTCFNATMGLEISSSPWAGVWIKAPGAFPGSSPVLDIKACLRFKSMFVNFSPQLSSILVWVNLVGTLTPTYMGNRFLSSEGVGKNCVLPMRVPNPSPTLDKNLASMGPGIISSIGVGVWRKAPEAFPDSNTTLDTFQPLNTRLNEQNNGRQVSIYRFYPFFGAILATFCRLFVHKFGCGFFAYNRKLPAYSRASLLTHGLGRLLAYNLELSYSQLELLCLQLELFSYGWSFFLLTALVAPCWEFNGWELQPVCGCEIGPPNRTLYRRGGPIAVERLKQQR